MDNINQSELLVCYDATLAWISNYHGDSEMPIKLGVPELLIILVIIVLLFGVGRIGKLAGELGKGIRSFKDGLSGNEKPEPKKSEKDEK